MLSSIKKWWKFSTLRFYVLNAIWNYNFWLKCTKEYKIIQYYHFKSPRQNPNFEYHNSDDIPTQLKPKSKKRFMGYRFQGKLYMDNPGLPVSDKEIWKRWHQKGLI